MQIPNWPVSTDRELELLREVLESGRWGGHSDFVKRLEREFAAFTHCAHAVSAMNGTVTLEMALCAADVGSGDEVIVPAISFVSTAMAVSRVGAVPVFVDIETLSFNMDPERAAAAITPRTKAIIAVHFGGAIADLDRLAPLAAEHGLALIEDAAHAHGSEWGGRRAGSLALAGSFSFQNSKVMTAGEGGMLTASDAAFAERAWSIMDQGRKPGGGWFHHYALGSNYRITGLQAAVLLAQLERLPEQICRRTRNAVLLRTELADVTGLAFQAVPPQQNANSWYLLLGRIDAQRLGRTRDDFHRALTAQGVPCAPFYPHPLYGNPLYREGGCRVEPCPVAEACISDAFWLPHRALLGDEQTTREIADAIIKACERGVRMMNNDRSPISRRGFVQTAALAAGTLAAADLTRAAAPAADVKIGLYSITYGGVWYRGDALTVEQVVERAHKFGYQGVEIDGKRPHGNPLDMPRARCRELRRMAADRGLEIYAVAANNDFSSPIPEHRESQLVYTRELMRMTGDLGANVLRVFLGWPGVTLLPEGGGSYDFAKAVWKDEHHGFSAEQTWAWCRASLTEAARLAGDFGVTLALQNHPPVIDKGYVDCLRMVNEVGSPHLKICFDARLEHTLDEAGVRKAVNEVGSLQTLWHYGGEYDRGPDGITVKGDEKAMAEMLGLFDIGYRGYAGFELCHPLPVVNGQTVGLDFVDKNAQLAAEYMRGILAEVKKLPASRG